MALWDLIISFAPNITTNTTVYWKEDFLSPPKKKEKKKEKKEREREKMDSFGGRYFVDEKAVKSGKHLPGVPQEVI